MNSSSNRVERVIGLDVHPDTFTAVILQGTTPRDAIKVGTFNALPLKQLESWVTKHTTASDVLLLEASGNSFHVARRILALQRTAKVLESCQLGRLKETYANNDKLSAERIARAFLSGLAKEVWIPDSVTQARRNWLHAYQKAVKDVTRLNNRLSSFLSDNSVRLEESLLKRTKAQLSEEIRQAHTWSTEDLQIVDFYLDDLFIAIENEKLWSSRLARVVLEDPLLLSLVRLTGVRDVISFAIGAIVGDINRFEGPKNLVKYVGLHPAFDSSGNQSWEGGLSGHGHKYLRSLLAEAAQSIMRAKDHPLAAWGKKLLARKGEWNLVVAAVARKLLVSIWYLMKGKFEPVEEVSDRLKIKVGRIISRVGTAGLEKMGTNRVNLREAVLQRLKNAKIYHLRPSEKLKSKSQDQKTKAPTTRSARSVGDTLSAATAAT